MSEGASLVYGEDGRMYVELHLGDKVVRSPEPVSAETQRVVEDTMRGRYSPGVAATKRVDPETFRTE